MALLTVNATGFCSFVHAPHRFHFLQGKNHSPSATNACPATARRQSHEKVLRLRTRFAISYTGTSCAGEIPRQWPSGKSPRVSAPTALRCRAVTEQPWLANIRRTWWYFPSWRNRRAVWLLVISSRAGRQALASPRSVRVPEAKSSVRPCGNGVLTVTS